MLPSCISQGNSVTVGTGVLETQTSPSVSFRELLRQRFDEGNTVQQCPCVIPPNSDRCIAYDSKYLAASVEEAIVAFVDFTVDDYNSHSLNRMDYNCTTEECIQCAALLFYRLKEIGFIPQNFQSRFSFPLPELKDVHPLRCRKFWMTRRRVLRGPPTITPVYVRQLIQAGEKYVPAYARFPATSHSQQVINSLSDSNGPQYQTVLDGQRVTAQVYDILEAVGEFPAPSQPQPILTYPAQYSYPAPAPTPAPQPVSPGTPNPLEALIAAKVAFINSLLGLGRKKRSTPNVSDGTKIIGQRFVISCAEKGDAESDETDFLNLCTACWTWRKLPDDYFPPILNELVCQENDFCLSGWGSCTQRYRQVDVLRRVNGKWSPTTMVAGSCCDCKVRAGTEIHQLVIGNTHRPRIRNTEGGILPYALRNTVNQPITTSTSFPPGEVDIDIPGRKK